METSRIDNQVPFMAIHPTEIIKDEIKERGMSQKNWQNAWECKPPTLAECLGKRVHNICFSC